LAYHLGAILALHHFTSNNKKPIPSFLFLDQPTQVLNTFLRDAEPLPQGEQTSATSKQIDHRFYGFPHSGLRRGERGRVDPKPDVRRIGARVASCGRRKEG
jgi:hypothetical protein